MKIIDVDQGSEAWFAARAGLPTASAFSVIMRADDAVTRSKLLHKLAFEKMTGEVAPEGYKSAAMQRGNDLEAEARDSYMRRKDIEIRQVGFVRNFEGLKACGASPDGLIGFDGGLEIKTAEPHILIPMLSRPALPAEHRAQVQGSMWVCEREWWDVTIYCHRAMPAVDVRVYRDDNYIKQLSDQVERFNYDLKKLVESLERMGAAG
jgi:hypothetical protein